MTGKHQPKSRACVGCSFRRLPCDGKLPCAACTRDGQLCKRFARRVSTKRKARPQAPKEDEEDDDSPSPPMIRAPSSLTPFVSTNEKRTFEFFRLNSLHGLPSGFFGSNIWNGEILAASMRIPELRQAIIAFGASLPRIDGSSGEVNQYAYLYYGRAMKTLRQTVAKNQKLDLSIVLVICLLFALTECRFRNWVSAKKHYDGALAIIDQLESAETHGTSLARRQGLSESIRTETIITLSGLGLQFAALFPDTKRKSPNPGPTPSGFTTTILPLADDMPPESLHAQGEALQRLLGRMTRRVWHEYLNVVHDGEQYPTKRSWLREQLLHSMWSWEIELRREDRAQYFPDEVNDAYLIEAHIICLRLLATGMLSTPRTENIWDSLSPDFERLLFLVQKVVEAEECSPFPFARFNTDFGVSGLLMFIITKCREPYVRHPALRVLGGLNHNEGIWHSRDMHNCLKKLVEREEEGLIILQSSDIPESRRISGLQFDTSGEIWQLV